MEYKLIYKETPINSKMLELVQDNQVLKMLLSRFSEMIQTLIIENDLKNIKINKKKLDFH